MHNSAWIALLRLIPQEQHDNLVLTPVSGVEINIQAILRTEVEYVVLRGRLAGSTDTGRIFFVPYDHISFLNFIKPVKEAEVQSFFGAAPAAAAAEVAPTEAAAAARETPPTEAPPQPAPAAPPPAAAAEAPPPRAPLAGKTAILDRLRARVAPNPPKPPDK